MSIKLPNLPYDKTALVPYISSETMKFHYGKHHRRYVNKLNRLIKGTKLVNKGLEDIVLATIDDPKSVDIFNNAAQVWNHKFYWLCMNPDGARKPTSELADKIGDFKKFKKEFIDVSLGQFGSGWVWIMDRKNIEIVATSNAEIPAGRAIAVCDLWEHAYYLDWQNDRKGYVTAFFDHLLDWDFVARNMR